MVLVDYCGRVQKLPVCDGLVRSRLMLDLSRHMHAIRQRQIQLHHVDNELNKLHIAVTERRTQNVPATAESNGGAFFLDAFRFRYGSVPDSQGVTYRTKWDVEPAHQSFSFSRSPVPSGS